MKDQRAGSDFRTMRDQPAHQPPSRLPYWLCIPGLLGAVLGGGFGFIGGGLVAAINCVRPSVAGAIIGTSVLIPAGFLLARRPSVPATLLVGTLLVVGAIALGGLTLAFATGQPAVIVAVPVVQLLLVTYTWCRRPGTES